MDKIILNELKKILKEIYIKEGDICRWLAHRDYEYTQTEIENGVKVEIYNIMYCIINDNKEEITFKKI